MRRLVQLIPGLLLVGAACSSNNGATTTTTTPLQSCFDTGGGHMRCVATPSGADTTMHDVDGDGKPDTFVCVTGGKPEDDEGMGDDKADNETGDGGATKGDDHKDTAHDGGKSEGDHPRGSRDGGAAKGHDAGKGAQRCENMGCQDLRKKAGHREDAHGDRARHDGGSRKGDDEGQGSNDEHDGGSGDDMMCPVTPPPPTPPVVPSMAP